MSRKSVGWIALISLISVTANASSEWLMVKDAQPCKKAGSVTQLAAPYVAAATQAQLEREKAEKAKKQQDAQNTVLGSGAFPQGAVKLPPGVTNATSLVPQWKPGQTWQPGQTAFKPAPGQTPAPTTTTPSTQVPNSPVGIPNRPRPVNCGHH